MLADGRPRAESAPPGPAPTRGGPPRGALVISLDFELHWGMRDESPANGEYRANLLGVWDAVPRMLELFEEFEVSATWATVGFLFARSPADLERFAPAARPAYDDPALNPYGEAVGEDERADPIHFAPSLIRAIRATPGQEVATHTFSHYYCLAPGQTRETFAADLESAVRIASRDGVELHSIVFPRNQHNPLYDDVLLQAGIGCYRGRPRPWHYRDDFATMRAARLADTYLNLSRRLSTPWERIVQPNGLCNVPASFFLRPWSAMWQPLDGLRVRRIQASMERAAIQGEVVHLWWHPHNFGRHLEENLAILRRLLEAFAAYRARYGMCSMTMSEVAEAARLAAGVHA